MHAIVFSREEVDLADIFVIGSGFLVTMADMEPDFEEQESLHGTMETLALLGLSEDFVAAVAETKSEDAAIVSLDLQAEFVSIAETEAAVAEQRRALAAEARADRVRYRPPGTTKTYQSGVRFYQVPF